MVVLGHARFAAGGHRLLYRFSPRETRENSHRGGRSGSRLGGAALAQADQGQGAVGDLHPAAGQQAASREPNIRETAEPEDDSFEDSLEDGSFEEEPEDFPEDEEEYDDFEFVDLDLDEDDESSDDKKNKEDEEDDDLELIDL